MPHSRVGKRMLLGRAALSKLKQDPGGTTHIGHRSCRVAAPSTFGREHLVGVERGRACRLRGGGSVSSCLHFRSSRSSAVVRTPGRCVPRPQGSARQRASPRLRGAQQGRRGGRRAKRRRRRECADVGPAGVRCERGHGRGDRRSALRARARPRRGRPWRDQSP